MRLKLENNTILPFLLTNLNGGGKSLYNLLKSLRSLFLKRLSSRFICFFSFMSKSVFGVRYSFFAGLEQGRYIYVCLVRAAIPFVFSGNNISKYYPSLFALL